MAKTSGDVMAMLLQNLEQAYHRRSWHGPNLKGSIRGLSAAQAAWKPSRDRKGIWEITLHAAYYKYVVRRRLLGEKRGSFPLTGSNWFSLPKPITEKAWREATAILEGEHVKLRRAIESTRESELAATRGGPSVTVLDLILGVAHHDVYHAGQIQLLKRLQHSGG
ncbi:MAG: DinB family protein [Planctomycetota bacterium]